MLKFNPEIEDLTKWKKIWEWVSRKVYDISYKVNKPIVVKFLNATSDKNKNIHYNCCYLENMI